MTHTHTHQLPAPIFEGPDGSLLEVAPQSSMFALCIANYPYPPGTKCMDSDHPLVLLMCTFMCTFVNVSVCRLPLWFRAAAIGLRYDVGRSVSPAAQRVRHRTGHWPVRLHAQCHLLLLLVQVQASTPPPFDGTH